MFLIEAHDRFHAIVNDDAISCCGIPLPYGLTTDLIVSLIFMVDFIDRWLKSFENDYSCQTMMYIDKVN